MFSVGQKIVCVRDASDCVFRLGEKHPRIGSIYTVRGVVSSFCDSPDEAVYLWEIVNPRVETIKGFIERPYWHGLFRPIQEQSTETGMAILRGILKGDKIREDA